MNIKGKFELTKTRTGYKVEINGKGMVLLCHGETVKEVFKNVSKAFTDMEKIGILR